MICHAMTPERLSAWGVRLIHVLLNTVGRYSTPATQYTLAFNVYRPLPNTLSACSRHTQPPCDVFPPLDQRISTALSTAHLKARCTNSTPPGPYSEP